MNAIIIDDEPFARKGLENYLKDISYIKLISVCENAMEGLEVIQKQKIDLMFLDINMPKINGIDFLKTLKQKPITIITSAHNEYALDGYELDVLDYLVKPIGFERFLKACNKAYDFWNCTKAESKETSPEEYIFIKCDKKIEKIFFKDILYIESLHNYVSIVLENEKHISYLTLKSIEEKLPSSTFLKIQKSFIISLPKITKIENYEIIIKDKRIKMSKINREETLKTILGEKFLKR